MTRHSETLQALRETGHRLTPQRVMVLSAIADCRGHVGADEVFERVRQAYPYVDMATVYRTLQLLVKLHMVTEIQSGSVTRYELVQGKRHHHMVCEACGATFDLPPQYLDALRERLVAEVGFEPHMEHFTISGLCARCKGQGPRKGQE